MNFLQRFDVPSIPQILDPSYSIGTIIALVFICVVVICVVIVAILLIRRSLRKKRMRNKY